MDGNTILGIAHNLVHAVRCKALYSGTDAEASYEADRVNRWERLVATVREGERQLSAVTAQRDKLLKAALKARDLMHGAADLRDLLESAITPVERQGNV